VGVKLEGGLLDHVVREVSVSCLPVDIPESLDLDVSEVHVGQHLSVRDIRISDKIRIIDDPDQTVIVVALPKAEEVAAPVRRARHRRAPAEPEVIKRGRRPPRESFRGQEGRARRERSRRRRRQEVTRA
jgi:large subunit ribosomal protein L25